MSNIVAEFNPATSQSTSFTVPQSAANGALVFWNESNVSLNISLQDGTTFYLPAWYNKHICGYSGNVNITWSVRTVLNSGLPPTSELIVESYAHGEHFPGDGSLVRQANGDTNSTVTTTQNTLINDGSAPGTQVIEVTPASGSSGSVLVVDNSGNFQLGDSTNQQGKITLYGNIIIHDSTGHIDYNGTNMRLFSNGGVIASTGGVDQMTVNGGGVVITAGKIGQSASGDIIDASGSTTIINGTSIALNSNTTANQNFIMTNGKVNRIGGNNIAAMSHFTATTASTVVVNHNFANGTPNWVGITTNSGTNTATVGYTSVTSTQVTIINGSTVSMTFSCVATAV